MKLISLLLAIATVGPATAFANSIVVSERTVTVPVDLSKTKVVFTNQGYGSTYLVKVLIPALAAPTLLNHRNGTEGAPCMATYDVSNVDDVLQGKPETINADVKITLTKNQVISDDGKTCTVTLNEYLQTTIRGFEFVHDRTIELPSRVADDCR
jgi:hypothetical protein